MKAAIYTQYGPPEVLRVVEIDRPVPQNNQVLVKVHYATVNRTDCGYRSAVYFVSRLVTGLVKPKRTVGGSEFAGEVVQIGEVVSDYKIGDKVFAFDDVSGGGHGEFVVKSEKSPMAIIPVGLSFREAAAAGEGAMYALNVIDAAGDMKDKKVLVYGASGSIGLAALQLLKYKGATVTAVCGSRNIDLVKSLGADVVIGYDTDDFGRLDEQFHFIFDAVGKRTYGECKRLLTPTGTYYSSELGPGGQNIFLAIWFALIGTKRVSFPIPHINKQYMEKLRLLLEAGAYKPVIDREYALDDIIEATKYVESQRKTGSVVIKVAG